MKQKLKDADEFDTICSRHIYRYLCKPGKTKAIKARLNRRFRREWKQARYKGEIEDGL